MPSIITVAMWVSVAAAVATLLAAGPASARNCKQLRALCITMRDDKSDCARPYQRCLVTGTFITPLGRAFKVSK